MGYEDQNVTELRKLAIDRGVAWKDGNSKPLIKRDLVTALYDADADEASARAAAEAHAATEGPQDEPTTAMSEGAENGPLPPPALPADPADPETPAPLQGEGGAGEPQGPQEPSPGETADAPADTPPASGASASDDGGGETDLPEDDEPEITIEPPYRQPEAWIRITEDVRFRKGGVTHKLAKGSVISNRTHDVEALGPQLEAQGWPIEECGPPDGGLNGYGKPLGRVFGPPLPTTRDQRTFDEEVNPQLYVDRDASGQTLRLEGDGSRTVIPAEEPRTVTTADGRTAVARTSPDTGKPSPGAVTNG